jgi:hypothetical protein
MADSDAERLVAMIGLLASDQEGERHSALRKIAPLLKKLKLTWIDIGLALMQRERLLAAAQQLQAERDQALVEVERLRRNANANGGGSLAQALWQDTAMPRSIENKHAQWLLDLAGQGRLHLTSKEADFVQRCANWRGRLTPNQRPWLEDILRQAVARTGQAPPL